MKLLILLLCFSFGLAKNRLVVVSFDGFRYDFIDRGVTPNLHEILNKSTVAKFVVNIFPTQTFPNHFSIATGLYAENHGVLQSQVYDAREKKILKYGYDLWHYNESVLPIWGLNEKLGGVSGVCMWPGSDFQYNGTKQTYTLAYNQSVAFNDRVDTAVSWLKNPTKPANLVFMYFEEPDKHGHAYGPSAPETNEQIKRVDAVAKYLLDSLAKNGLQDTNVVFLSDHGMEGVYKKDIIDLESFVGKKAKFYGTSPALQIYPEEGKEEEVFKILDQKSKELKNFRVFKRDDIPDHFHYKKCSRSPPILALANPKYAFQDLYSGIEWYMEKFNVSDVGPFGVHGYDPDTIEMHPYFIASGPMFKENFRPPQLYTVDMSLLFARILGLNASKVRSDGSLDRINSVLTSSAPKLGDFAIVLFGVISFVILTSIITCYLIKRQKSFEADSGEYIKVDIDDDDDEI